MVLTFSGRSGSAVWFPHWSCQKLHAVSFSTRHLKSSLLPSIWARALFLGIGCVSSRTKENYYSLFFLLCIRGYKMQHFYFEKQFWQTPDHWIPIGFVPHPLDHEFYQGLQQGCLLFVLPDQHAVDIMLHCDILWVDQAAQIYSLPHDKEQEFI